MTITTADIANLRVADSTTADPFAPTDAKQLWPVGKRTATGTRTSGFAPYDRRIASYAVCEHGTTYVPDADYIVAAGDKGKRHATWHAMCHPGAWCDQCRTHGAARPVNVAARADAVESARIAAMEHNGR